MWLSALYCGVCKNPIPHWGESRPGGESLVASAALHFDFCVYPLTSYVLRVVDCTA